MAAPVHRLFSATRRFTCQIPSRRRTQLQSPYRSFRAFTTSPPAARRNDDNDDDYDDDEDDGLFTSRGKPVSFIDSLEPHARAHYESLSPKEREAFEADARKLDEYMTSPAVESELSAAVSQAAYEVSLESPQADELPERIRPGFMAMGEEDEQGTGEDDEFEDDDITSLGHGELEQHREMREYARIAAWEMPLLSKLAKPYVPPALDQPLRFRYTTYMGERHPAEKKVVLEFCTKDLPGLTEEQRIKLVKLVGVRYNPETDVVKMSSEMFETQAQNKRYLGDLVDTLMTEAKDATDMFADVPLDFRHHKFVTKPKFPDHWRMTPERKQQLEATHRQRRLLEQERTERGQLVDGVKLIETMLRSVKARDESAVLVEVQQGAKAKGKGKKFNKRQLR